ncbi:hypothetical protein GGX14DRAFT_660171 [Mycena pura]|uniref:Glycoside hydrolase family 38 central domain-containing protein n=1 Tax=Mycena pura TaxID=153505 RepID=A0AAD6Y792_9AGAR|nr:hypothetical protein GGX14DRAFT_660171 [Mycena pura]
MEGNGLINVISSVLEANRENLSKIAQRGTLFLDQYVDCAWPGGTAFATQGGDWEYPAANPVPGGYNWTGVPGLFDSNVTGKLTTFAEYYDTLMKTPTAIRDFTLFAENYYTGYFASRPQLKINHYEAAQLLLGAEVLGSIMKVYNAVTPAVEAELQRKIKEGWHLLVPSSHHDFVAGTAPDSVYDCGGSQCFTQCNIPNPPPGGVLDSYGQLNMSSQTVALARDAMNAALAHLSATIPWTPQPNIVPVVVFNQLGHDLPNTAIVEMDDPSGGTAAYEVVVDGIPGLVQRSWDGKLLLQVPRMQSMAYKVVHLRLGSPAPPFTPQPINDSTFNFRNSAVSLTLVRDLEWAIGNLIIGSKSYVLPGAPANHIGIQCSTSQ